MTLRACVVMVCIAATSVACGQDADARRPPSPGQGQAVFFGLEAPGRKFVYVCDHSASMADPAGLPLAAAKRELLASLESLGDARQFHVIVYNDHPTLFASQGHRGRPTFADEDGLRAVRRFVDGVDAAGGTRHYEAIAAALRLAPDAVFVLTDADDPDDLTADEVARLTRSLGHARCMVAQFGGGEGRRSPNLARLAAASGGEYRIVDADAAAPAQ